MAASKAFLNSVMVDVLSGVERCSVVEKVREKETGS
jgi:hypothetical protein